MNVLAVDPGLSGAVVLVGPGVLEVHRDFKNWEDIAASIGFLGQRAGAAVMELVHAMPGQGVTSMFTFGSSTGVALGALRAHGFSVKHSGVLKPLIEVPPQRWVSYYRKAHAGTFAREFDSAAIACLVLPAAAPYLQRKKDHNTADAILMALWLLMNTGAVTTVRMKDRIKRKRKSKQELTLPQEPSESAVP